tara:strand:- start:1034 stop:1573 length:540 start_codon:yes stop_codon:yes gene_type:complete
MLISAAKTEMKNVLLFEHQVHEDHRGTYEEIYNEKDYSMAMIDHLGFSIQFFEDDFAVSNRHVLRGIHGDDRTWKLVTCLRGRFYIVVVNCNEDDDEFGKWKSFTLSSENKKQVLVPPWHGHAYVVMTDDAIFHYKQSCIYEGMRRQFTYKHDDPTFEIWWPVKNPILSKRDTSGKVDG